MARAWQPVKAFIRRVWSEIDPGPDSLRGAAAAVLVVGGLVYLAFAISAARGPLLFALPALLVLALLGGLLAFLGQGVAWLIGVLASIPWRYRWALLATVALVAQSLGFLRWQALTVIALVLLLAASLLGMGAWRLARERPATGRARKILAAAFTLVGGLALLAALAWYGAWRGPAEPPVIDAAALSGGPPARIELPDPSQPGPYAVKTLTYGSGQDRYRPEFGAQAGLITQPVNGARLLAGSWKGFFGQLRTLAWGFDPANLPLNGRVWYPDGPGPFPLVVIVHGNHNMMDFSDPGYAYLGELLASRGFIFVSVDQNFINGGLVDFLDRFSGENDARGWLLLEHLRIWHAWNDEPTSPFYRLVDTTNLAVGGHSRGGEAAAVAAAFNRLRYYPDNFTQSFNYGYAIRAVFAIAPIDGQYQPARQPTPLADVHYFVLQGSHDSDLTSYSGINQYARVTFDPASDGFKAGLYVYRANHGQFNSVWGDSDVPALGSGFLNRAALLTGEEQRQVARVYLSAFLEAALRGERGYLPLFQDARAAGDGWLPATIYLHQYAQAGDRIVAAFGEDIDLRTTTLPGGSIRGENLLNWREQTMHSKWSETQLAAVYLNWRKGEPAVYAIELPAGEDLALRGAEALIFNLADANQDPAPTGPADGGVPRPGPRQPLDFDIVLVDSAGQRAGLALSQYGMVQPQLSARLYKAGLFEKYALAEPVLQSWAIPLADFTAANPAFDPAQLREIRFEFDRTRPGSLIIESVGLRP